jgi:hypothetical protein
MNPDSEVATKYKLKENYIIDKVKESFPDLDFIHNKKIQDGCSRRRPDLYLDCGTHNLVIEIDENQHGNYSCENKRIMELFQDGGSISLCVIRFNPDKYELGEEKHEGCFEYTKTGKLKVKSSFKSRFKVLKTVIEKYRSKVPDKEITEVKLFYTEN